jgi:putative membrane protein insertion efficiency factor
MKRLALLALQGYQRTISPTLAPACRFEPSCSRYGYQAIEQYGAIRGGWMLLRRLARCHPLQRPRYDPVP